MNIQIIDPKTTYIDEQTTIGEGTTIFPNTTILGKTQIGKNCEIGPNSIISDSNIKDNCVIFSSVVKNSNVGKGCDIGPFAHLRNKVELMENVHIGNYVELKKSTVGKNTKIGHVSYIGDCEIGEKVNIGAGTIVANYDGFTKHKTVIGSNAFIGANTVLVAPVIIGKGSKTAAGAVVRNNVEDNTLVAGVPATPRKKI